MRLEFRLAGSGGQGLVTAGIVLAEAASSEWNHVLVSQVYGPEARGGATRIDVIISDDPIYYPKTGKLDVLLAMTREALDKYKGDLEEGGLLIADSGEIDSPPRPGALLVPIARTAGERLGAGKQPNMVALGALIAIANPVDPETAMAAMAKHLPEKQYDLGLVGFALGMELGRKALAEEADSPSDADL